MKLLSALQTGMKASVSLSIWGWERSETGLCSCLHIILDFSIMVLVDAVCGDKGRNYIISLTFWERIVPLLFSWLVGGHFSRDYL